MFAHTHSLFGFVVGIAGDKQTCTRKDNGPEQERQEREMFPRHNRSWEGLSGDEYECLKMKCLSQYGDSAGTQVTEECSATPTLRV